MRIVFLMLLCYCCLPTAIKAQQQAFTKEGRAVVLYDNGIWAYADTTNHQQNTYTHFSYLELPRLQSNETIVTHTGYSLSYNEEYEQARWVAYMLTKEKAVSSFERSNQFLTDPMITTATADDDDYKSSGYDRGHLAPAADMGWSATTMQESFYYSNMSPQVPGFNRGIWKRLEELVRHWANEYDSLYITTGPVLTKGLPTIGHNNVAVPNYYYKAILKCSKGDTTAIGFLLPNEASSASLERFAISIDSVEAITGLDLFPLLPDYQESSVEETIRLESWKWSKERANPTPISKEPLYPVTNSQIQKSYSSSGSSQTTSVQCSGTTKAGKRCQRMTTSSNGWCWQHGG